MKDTNIIFCCFWIFGILNNVLYVVILSAAVDLAGPDTPKAVILLADILPAFFLKVVAPLFIHKISYRIRIVLLVGLSVLGMLLIAFIESFTIKLCGVLLASTSSGLGEISFLALTHFYEHNSLAGFSSGTGAAGLVGSFVYLLFTTWLGVSIKATLALFAFVPFTFLYIYGGVLPQKEYSRLGSVASSNELSAIDVPTGGLYSENTQMSFSVGQAKETVRRVLKLVVPFMLPLSLVYMAEYTINQGVAPTLLYPLDQMPFAQYRDVYVTYSMLYQLGVFISRSSSAFVRIRRLYIPAALQLLNLALSIVQALYMVPFPNIYVLMLFMFYEGILGGLAYVNTFSLVLETVPHESREFAMGAVGMSDSGGIVIAGILSLWLETSLCGYQARHDRPWCTLT